MYKCGMFSYRSSQGDGYLDWRKNMPFENESFVILRLCGCIVHTFVVACGSVCMPVGIWVAYCFVAAGCFAAF
jgi:hypothetical protein